MQRGFSKIGALFSFGVLSFFAYSVFASPAMGSSGFPSSPTFGGTVTVGQLNVGSSATHIQDESGNLVHDVASGKGMWLEVDGTKIFSIASNGDISIGASQLYGMASGTIVTNQLYGPTNNTQIKINSALASADPQADFLITTQNDRSAGNLLDVQDNGTSRFRVAHDGNTWYGSANHTFNVNPTFSVPNALAIVPNDGTNGGKLQISGQTANKLAEMLMLSNGSDAGNSNYLIYSARAGSNHSIETSKNGTGVARPVEFKFSGSTKFILTTNGLTVGSSDTGPFVSAGSGSPEGAVTAPVGSLYMRTDGGAGTSFYVKESGSGNTGWVAK